MSGLVVNLTPCSIHKSKPIPKNEIFPDDVNFAYTKKWMDDSRFDGRMEGQGNILGKTLCGST